jgi:serine phosphatase RsbU (regulator of sigma subunit)
VGQAARAARHLRRAGYLEKGEAMKAVFKERQDMAEKIKKLKDQQAEAIKAGVKTEIDKMDKLISEKQNLAASIEIRVNELREARRQIDKNVEIEEAYKAADKEITSALYRVAIVLKDVLEDYPMPEKFEPRFKKYMSEMQNGINYISSYFEQGGI